MDWFLYDNGLRLERVTYTLLLLHLFITHLVIDFITMSLTYVLGNYYDLYKYH